MPRYKFTQESGADFKVVHPDKSDAQEDTNEVRRVVDDLGNLLVHSKRDDSYPKDGTTGGNLAIPESQLNISNIVFCSDYDHPDDAITAIASANKTLLVTEAETCDTNFTVPANVTVRFERGGKWTINNGITVTFNGQIDAGLWQIFAYTGTGTLAGTISTTYPQWWGALGDGSNNDSTAIQEAINRGKHTILPYTSTGYRSATQMSIDSYHILDCYADIDVDVPVSDAFLTLTDCSRSQLRFHRKVEGRAKENDCIRIISGVNNRIFINYAKNFRYIVHLKQVTESSGTENIIEYNTLHDSTKGIYISSPPGEQSAQPWEGLQLMGGFIVGCGHCIHIESGVNANYSYIQGSIDGMGANLDYVNESSLTHLLLNLKYIRQANSTFAKGDILFDTRLSQIYMKAGGTSPSIKIVDGDPSGQAVSDMKGIFDIGGKGNTNTKEGIIIGKDSSLASAIAATINLFYDVKGGTASGEKEGGIQLVYRRNDDASAIAGGKVVIRKEAGSNYCSINFYRNEADLIAKFDVSGHLSQFGGQIAFPATQVPSANANTLDDYEEKEWTPIIAFGGASEGVTYSVQSGLCTKIGRQVTITGRIILTAKGTSVGDAKISALPFTNKDSYGAYSAVSLSFSNITFANIFQGIIMKNTSDIWLSECLEDGTSSQLNNTNFANDSHITFSATYFTD